ncbi:MAG: multicopper oxidase family protein [Rhodoglobus sp.]
MVELSRRQVIILGGVGAGLVVAGGATVALSQSAGDLVTPLPSTPPPAGSASGLGTLAEPAALASSGGQLTLDLTAATTTVEIDGKSVNAVTYNGGLPGPTLRLKAGDTVSLTFANQLDAPTNLHTHGLVVSPEGNSDNVFVKIDPGATHDYVYKLGPDHPPGVFWYHPHHHGISAEQLFGGLYGAIIVEDEAEDAIAADRERVLVISDIGFDASGTIYGASNMTRMQGREGDLVMVNGQVGASMLAQPGERERWRVVNACASRYLRLRLDGQSLTLLGIDGARYEQPRAVEEFVLMPGNRADLLVTMTEGESMLQTLPFDRGSAGMGAPASNTTGADLATLTVSGTAASAAAPIPQQAAQRDLRLEPITGRRTITLAMGGMGMGGGMSFTIDGKEFGHDRIDTEIKAGAIEEWTIENTSTMDHPFHLHVWPMQLVEANGAAVPGIDYQDVVPVPARGRAVVRIAFEGLTGKTVYHCHILDHEDQGMMGIIRSS